MISVNNISKNFNLCKRASFLEFIRNFFNKENRELKSLKNINFDLIEKDVLGIIGENGAGKSTLLKIIAGIIKPTSGDIFVDGNIVYISGFNNGLNKDLSLKDNIYLIGTLNGLNKKQIDEKIKTIIDFSELFDFQDTNLNKFSTGMISRLAFSINFFTLPENPDVLLLDETLGGGLDEYFLMKADLKIKEYISNSKTTIIVSHNKKYILDNCNKVLWLKKGEMFMFGDSAKIIESYSQFVRQNSQHQNPKLF